MSKASKVCCVSQCPSKSGSKESTRSLFRINKNSPTYDNVLNAIGHNMKQTKVIPIPKHLFICDLHFEGSCIERTDISLWKDGEKVIIPRKVPRLKAGSLPTIFPEGNNKRLRRTKALRPVNDNEAASTAVQKNRAAVDKDLTSEVTGGLQQKDHDYCKNNQLPPPPATPQMVAPAPDKLALDQNCTSFETQYTPEALMQDWKSSALEEKVPGDWALVCSNFGVLLAYCGDTGESVTRTVLVKNDMSVEVRYEGRIAASPPIDKVSSFQQLLGFLLAVTCSHVCEGIENHQSCPNVFYIRKPFARCNRCPHCQIEFKKHSKREKRRILQEKKERKIGKNLKRKYRRSVAKMSENKRRKMDLGVACSSVDDGELRIDQHNSENEAKAIFNLDAAEFREAVKWPSFVDRSLLIKELLSETKSEPTMILAPKRFGKSMNVSMIKRFFEIEGDRDVINAPQDLKELENFENFKAFNRYEMKQPCKILAEKDLVKEHFGRHPVLCMNLKDVDVSSIQDLGSSVKELVHEAYLAHSYLADGEIFSNPRDNECANQRCRIWCDVGKYNDQLPIVGLQKLVEYLHAYHKRKVYLLVDEFDAPALKALQKGEGELEVMDVRNEIMRLLGVVLKGPIADDHLLGSVLTGVCNFASYGASDALNMYMFTNGYRTISFLRIMDSSQDELTTLPDQEQERASI